MQITEGGEHGGIRIGENHGILDERPAFCLIYMLFFGVTDGTEIVEGHTTCTAIQFPLNGHLGNPGLNGDYPISTRCSVRNGERR